MHDAPKWCGERARQTQVEVGVAVLSAFVKNIAESLLDEENDVLENCNTAVGETRAALRWKNLVDYLRALDSPSFPIPSLRSNLDWGFVRVAKGTFNRDTSCLPDPFLLAAKAAINFSSLVGKKLMPVCQPSSSNEEEEEVDNDDF